MQQQKTAIALIALLVAMGGFLLAFDASVILGVIKFMEPAFNLSKIELGPAVAFVSLTATAVMMVAWSLRDKYGQLIVLKYVALLNPSTAILPAISLHFYSGICPKVGGDWCMDFFNSSTYV